MHPCFLPPYFSFSHFTSLSPSSLFQHPSFLSYIPLCLPPSLFPTLPLSLPPSLLPCFSHSVPTSLSRSLHTSLHNPPSISPTPHSIPPSLPPYRPPLPPSLSSSLSPSIHPFLPPYLSSCSSFGAAQARLLFFITPFDYEGGEDHFRWSLWSVDTTQFCCLLYGEKHILCLEHFWCLFKTLLSEHLPDFSHKCIFKQDCIKHSITRWSGSRLSSECPKAYWITELW